MVTAGPLSAVPSPVIRISETWKPKVLRLFFSHLELSSSGFIFSEIHILFSLFSPSKHQRGLSCHHTDLFLEVHFLHLSATGSLKPASRQIGHHPIKMILRLLNNYMFRLSLSADFDDIIVIIGAAGAADIPAVHQHGAPGAF